MRKKERKSFWAKPEGITALFLLALLGVTLYLIYPFLYPLMMTTVGLIVLFILTCAIVYILIDNQIRTAFWRGFQNDMRIITGLFWQVEALPPPDSLADQLGALIHTLEEKMNQLKVYQRNVKDLIDIYEIKGETEALQALQPNKRSEATQTITYEHLAKEIDTLYEFLLQQGREAVALYKQLKATPDQKGAALLRSEEEAAQFSYVVEVVTDFNEALDLKAGTYDADAFLQLRRWQKKQVAKEKKTKKPVFQKQTTVPKTSKQDNKYNDLFDF
ncbi:MAG: hypothetical protein ACFB0B_19065 [Thermonemataceae bacterium]